MGGLTTPARSLHCKFRIAIHVSIYKKATSYGCCSQHVQHSRKSEHIQTKYEQFKLMGHLYKIN